MDDRFYHSKKWEKKRAHILKRDAYTDQLELRAGKRVPANLVHHIFPREQYPQYQWEDWNLISISRKTHSDLHTITGNLSSLGEKLKREVGAARGIKYYERILVVGLPGAGKTTWAKANLGSGLCYDLDYIAAAFRLKEPKAEDHNQARLMANSMCKAFALNAERYTSRIIIIRTAPTIDELESLEPDRIIYCDTQYVDRKIAGWSVENAKERLKDCLEWARANGVTVTKPSTTAE